MLGCVFQIIVMLDNDSMRAQPLIMKGSQEGLLQYVHILKLVHVSFDSVQPPKSLRGDASLHHNFPLSMLWPLP